MMLPSSHNAVSSHNGAFSWCWRKDIQQEKGEVCGAVALQVLETRLYSVSKTCIFQRSSGRGLKNFQGEAPGPLFCCTAVAIKKCEKLLPQTT